MLCGVIVGPSYDQAALQIEEASRLCNLVELRIDLFDKVDFNALEGLLKRFSIPTILTLRSASQGGRFRGDLEQNMRSLAKLKPAFLDVEYDAPSDLLEELQALHPDVKFILTYHNVHNTPDDLPAIFQQMRKKRACYYKVAVTAENSLDALRFILWAKSAGENIIPISMGPFGQISRVLSPILKSPITYASLSSHLTSAPGQINAGDLLSTYNFRSLKPTTHLFGLIGNPIDKSIGNVAHNRAFFALGFDAVYVKMQLQPGEIGQFLKFAKELPFKGLSVTMPLKEEVMAHLDAIDPMAEAMGAVNTLRNIDGKWHGYNTDGLGALNALEVCCPVQNKRVSIVGAGGAAKAIAVEANKRGAKLSIINRDKQKAEKLAAKAQGKAFSLDEVPSDYDILINCTSSLMPIKLSDIIPGTIIMDIQTSPKETDLLQEAKKQGCRCVYGYKMFIEQAIGQFAIWHDNKIDHALCRSILETAAS